MCSTVLQVISYIKYLVLIYVTFVQNCLCDLKNLLTNIFLKLVQLHITREASSRIYVILLLHFWLVLVFLIYKHVLQQVYEISGYFYHTFFKNFEKFKKLKIRKFVLPRNARETANATRVWCSKTTPAFRTIHALHYRSFIFCEPWGNKMSIEPKNLSAGRARFQWKRSRNAWEKRLKRLWSFRPALKFRTICPVTPCQILAPTVYWPKRA